MPLKLVPSKPGKTPYYYVRGTHHGVDLDRSTKFVDRAKAAKLLVKWREDIERGVFSRKEEPTFVIAAVDYIKAGGEARFIGRFDQETGEWSGLIAHFGETPLSEITQPAIDTAAVTLYPNATAATRNRQVHAPVSAILKRAGYDADVRRPKGWRGSKRTFWLQPEQAFPLFAAADAHDLEFGIFIRMLCYTGLRLDEGLRLTCDLLELSEAFVYVPRTKNEDPRGVYLPPVVVAALANHPRGLDRKGERIFRFRKCGRLYDTLDAVLKTAGMQLPHRTAFHVFRHTYATWMYRYGGCDAKALVETGAWRDPASADRYRHSVAARRPSAD